MQVSSTSSSSSSSSAVPDKGVAGRINYGAWDKLATDLVEQHNQEEQNEIASEKAKVRRSERNSLLWNFLEV